MKEIRDYAELKKELAFYADDDYREFAMKGIPCERPFIGVRIPDVRKVVNLIPRDCDEKLLKEKPVAIEEVLARGMIICRFSYEEMLNWFDSQISYIDNWCTCDIFCSGLRKVIKKHSAEFLDLKVDKLLSARDEYTVRVGLVMLKCAYVDFDYLNEIFERAEKLADREEYYIRMAIAWLLSECFIKFPAATTGYLVISHLPKWTFNKTISKICDSYRVDEETKKMLKKMRK
ncbi:DNA alkylation repair protein [Candidatus Saccharibacteria bacterium]|nr:DNA alkylation repair protein [Candidatus Saccharibacteria bacterium]